MGKTEAEGTRSTTHMIYPDDLIIIGHDTRDGAEHPLYDPRMKLPPDDAMVLNIMELGVLEPILARKNGAQTEVIDGRRRVINAREANKRLRARGEEELLVETKYKRGDDGLLFGMSVSSNEIRLDDTPMAKADKARRLIDMGKSEEYAAKIFGVSVTAIKQWLKLLDLSAYVRNKVDKAEISASAAAKFADLSHAEQKEAVDSLLKETNGKATTAKATTAGKKAKGSDNAYDVPGKKIIKRVIANAKAAEGVLTEDEVKILRWVIGDIGPASIRGLTSLMEEAEEEIAAE